MIIGFDLSVPVSLFLPLVKVLPHDVLRFLFKFLHSHVQLPLGLTHILLFTVLTVYHITFLTFYHISFDSCLSLGPHQNSSESGVGSDCSANISFLHDPSHFLQETLHIRHSSTLLFLTLPTTVLVLIYQLGQLSQGSSSTP